MIVNIIIIAAIVIVAIKEYKTFKLALSYGEDKEEEKEWKR